MSRTATRAVLAAAYRGRAAQLASTLTHTVHVDDAGAEVAVACGRVELEHLADPYASDPGAPPTCSRCL